MDFLIEFKNFVGSFTDILLPRSALHVCVHCTAVCVPQHVHPPLGLQPLLVIHVDCHIIDSFVHGGIVGESETRRQTFVADLVAGRCVEVVRVRCRGKEKKL